MTTTLPSRFEPDIDDPAVRDRVDEPPVDSALPVVRDTARPRRRWLGTFGLVCTIFGLFVLGFAAYEFWMTDLTEGRAQDALVPEFEQVLIDASVGEDAAAAEAEFGQFQDVLAEPGAEVAEEEVAVYEPPDRGAAVAYLRIDDIGLQKIVVEGTGTSDLKTGPGHYRDSPMPGQPGNAVLVGRRTTYGEPFRHIDRLDEGDEIQVVTAQGRFTYEVTDTLVVEPGDPDVMGQGDENTLTLVTSNPAYRSTERLAVRAALVGDAVRPPDDELEARRSGITTPLAPDENGVDRDAAAWGAALLWGELLVLSIVLVFVLRRRWQRWPTWLLIAPAILAFGFLTYESMDRLLPSTL